MTLVLPTERLKLPEADSRVVQSWKCDEVCLKPYDPNRDRTSRQNRYLWGVVYKYISAETGHTSEDIHAYCKWTFLPRKLIQIGNDERYIDKSTTGLSTEEFAQYVDQIVSWAGSELGIAIPPPDNA